MTDAVESAWPSPQRAWWAVGVFSVAAVVSYTDRQILSLLVDPLRAALHISDSQVGLLQGLAFALIYALAGLPLGRLADTMSRRLVIIMGVLIWSAGTVACGYAPNFAALFAARIAVGVGEAALAPAAISMIADLFPANRRGAATGAFLVGMMIGSGVAITLGGAILQAANQGLFHGVPIVGSMAPWRATLIIIGLPGPAVALLLLSVKEPVRRNRAVGAHPASLGASVAGFRARGGVLLPLYAAMALVSIGDSAIGNWSPTLMSRRFSIGPGEIGLLLGGSSIVTGIAGTVLGGLLADRMIHRGGSSRRLVIAAAAAAIGVAGGAIGFASSGLQVVGFFAFWAFMSAVSGTIGITSVQEVVTNEMRGLAVAINSVGNILVGVVVGTSLTAFLTDAVYRSPLAVGVSISSVAIPVGMAAAALFWLAYRNLASRTAGEDQTPSARPAVAEL